MSKKTPVLQFFRNCVKVVEERVIANAPNEQVDGSARNNDGGRLPGKRRRPNPDMDRMLAYFFFGCNIPFNMVESPWFIQFIEKLNPDYSPPNRRYLADVLVDVVYQDLQNEKRKMLDGSESVLLVDGWKNLVANTNNVVFCLSNYDTKIIFFLESYDFTSKKETADELSEVLDDAVHKSIENYNTDIVGVVSDNASNMTAMRRHADVWFSTCHSHSGNLLAKSLVDGDFAKEVQELVIEFRKPALEREIMNRGGTKLKLGSETRWCSYRDSFDSMLKNLRIMREIAESGEHTLKASSIQHLMDPRFQEQLENYITLFDPACKLINTCQKISTTIADAIEFWVNLTIPDGDEMHDDILKNRLDKVLTPIGFAANLLHPRYLGRNLSPIQVNSAKVFLFNEVGEDFVDEYRRFENQEGLIGVILNVEGEEIQKLCPVTFWSMVAEICPTLATVARKLLTIPASTAAMERVFSNWQYFHSRIRNRLGGSRSKKLVDIYFTLRSMTNIPIEEPIAFVDPN